MKARCFCGAEIDMKEESCGSVQCLEIVKRLKENKDSGIVQTLKEIGNSPLVKGIVLSIMLLIIIIFSISYRADLEHFSNKESIYDSGVLIGGIFTLTLLTMLGGFIQYFERRKKEKKNNESK